MTTRRVLTVMGTIPIANENSAGYNRALFGHPAGRR